MGICGIAVLVTVFYQCGTAVLVTVFSIKGLFPRWTSSLPVPQSWMVLLTSLPYHSQMVCKIAIQGPTTHIGHVNSFGLQLWHHQHLQQVCWLLSAFFLPTGIVKFEDLESKTATFYSRIFSAVLFLYSSFILHYTLSSLCNAEASLRHLAYLNIQLFHIVSFHKKKDPLVPEKGKGRWADGIVIVILCFCCCTVDSGVDVCQPQGFHRHWQQRYLRLGISCCIRKCPVSSGREISQGLVNVMTRNCYRNHCWGKELYCICGGEWWRRGLRCMIERPYDQIFILTECITSHSVTHLVFRTEIWSNVGYWLVSGPPPQQFRSTQ